MKNEFLKFSSRRILFSAAMVSALLAGSPQMAFAEANDVQAVMQTSVVKGRILDSTGEPIIGASIIEKGTTNGTITDIDGNFSLSVSSSKAILVVSYLGYKSVELSASDKKLNEIVLKEDTEMLDEVVVVGYGAVKKSDLTGAVASVSTKELTAAGISSAAGAMQGVVPGVNIQRSSNKPGSGYNILIRGLNTVSGSTKPLIVIDGVPGAELENINPDDIEKIDILKDASSTAIYGSRATNGVVIVTTKRGKAGAPKVSYDGSVGFKNYMNAPDMMDGQQYVQLAREYSRATKGNGEYVSDDKIFSASELVAIENNNYMDWFDALTSTAWMNSHTLSVSGGTEKSSYVASAGYHNEDGCLQPQFYKRYNLRAAVDVTPNDYFKFGVSLYGTFSDQETGNEDGLQTIYRLRPTYHPTNLVTGEQEFKYGSGQFNPFVTQKNQSWRYKKYDVLSNLFVEFNPIKNLALRSTFSPDLQFIDYGMYAGAYTKRNQGSQATAWYEKTTILNWVWDNMVTYNFDLMKDHHFDLTGVYSMTEYQNEFMRGDGAGLSYNSLWYALQNGAKTNKTQSKYIKTSLMSYLARLNYNYKGKYYVTASMRYDGSSKFPKSSRFGFFPSVSAGWQIAQERFMNSTRHWLDGLKLRASYGVIGNQNINPYTFTPSMSVNNKATSWIIDDTYVTSISSLPALVSQNFTWEKVGTINVGLDVNLFNNRLSGVFEWYQRNTNGMLAPGVQLPAVVGASAPYQNTADMRTRGWELSLNWRDQIGKVGYRIGFNLSDYKSEIIKYDDNAATKLLSSYYPGQTLGEIWGYVVDGYYTVDDFVDTSSWQLKEGVTSINGYNVRPGDVKFKNLRDDDTSTNVITSGDNTFDNPGDRKVIGNTTPRYQYGINLGMNYAGFDLNVILQGTGKRDYWISNVLTFPMNGDNFVPLFEGLSDYWMPKDPDNGDWSAVNPNAKYPRIYGNRGNSGSNLRQSDKYLSDASYLRIKNITLSYKLPKKWVNQIFLNQMKAFVSIENVATFTSLPSGIDPERIEWNYPAFRTVSFGVNITL